MTDEPEVEIPSDEELLAQINEGAFKGSPEYRKRMHQINVQIVEIARWLQDKVQVQLSGNEGNRLEMFMVFMLEEGILTEEQLERFNLSFHEVFLRDARKLRGDAQKWMTEQTLLRGVPGVDPNAGMTPGGRLLRGRG